LSHSILIYILHSHLCSDNLYMYYRYVTIYIYIYIYVCVCVCVWSSPPRPQFFPKKKRIVKKNNVYSRIHGVSFFFFFFNPRCPGQLTRTTTNPRTHWTPCKPSRQVKHRGDDRRARWGSNPGDRDKETLSLPLGHKPRCNSWSFLYFI
jgi:hypothetical protein